jgi:hypothetical protein
MEYSALLSRSRQRNTRRPQGRNRRNSSETTETTNASPEPPKPPAHEPLASPTPEPKNTVAVPREASSPVPDLQSTSSASTTSGGESPAKLDEIPDGIQYRKNDPNIQAQTTIQREPSIDSPSKQSTQDDYKSLLSRSRNTRRPQGRHRRDASETTETTNSSPEPPKPPAHEPLASPTPEPKKTFASPREASSPVPDLQSTSTASTKSGGKSPAKLDEIPGGIQDRKNDPNIKAQATIQKEPSIDSPSKQITQDNYKSLLSRSRKRIIQRPQNLRARRSVDAAETTDTLPPPPHSPAHVQSSLSPVRTETSTLPITAPSLGPDLNMASTTSLKSRENPAVNSRDGALDIEYSTKAEKLQKQSTERSAHDLGHDEIVGSHPTPEKQSLSVGPPPELNSPNSRRNASSNSSTNKSHSDIQTASALPPLESTSPNSRENTSARSQSVLQDHDIKDIVDENQMQVQSTDTSSDECGRQVLAGAFPSPEKQSVTAGPRESTSPVLPRSPFPDVESSGSSMSSLHSGSANKNRGEELFVPEKVFHGTHLIEIERTPGSSSSDVSSDEYNDEADGGFPLGAFPSPQADVEKPDVSYKHEAQNDAAESREFRIEKELNMIVQLTEENELDEPVPEEALLALMAAASKVAYTKKYHDVVNEKFVYFPSVVSTLIDYSLTDEAEQHYCNSAQQFSLALIGALRSTAVSLEKEDPNDLEYMKKLAVDVDATRSGEQEGEKEEGSDRNSGQEDGVAESVGQKESAEAVRATEKVDANTEATRAKIIDEKEELDALESSASSGIPKKDMQAFEQTQQQNATGEHQQNSRLSQLESNRKHLRDETPSPEESPPLDQALMEQAKELVKNTVLEMSKKAEEDEEVRQVVEMVMSQGIDGVLDFLSQHVKNMLPTELPSDTTNSNTETAVPAGNVDPELQVRNMVKHKLIFVQKETFLSHEDLERQVDQIMLLPRPKIVEFLEHAKPSQLAVNTDYWADLPEEIQQAARDLGYDEEAWNTGQQPEESDKVWEDLTPKQQAAAAKIGYNPYTWDGIEPPPAAAPAVPEPMTQEQIMMQKIRELVRQQMEQEQPFKSTEELEQAIDKIMILPKDQIKGYLQKTLVVKTTAEEPPTKLQKTITDVGDSVEGENEIISGFVLDDDDEDNKPLESSDDSSDDSSNDESDDDEQHNEEMLSGFVLDVDEEDKKPMDDDSSSDRAALAPTDESVQVVVDENDEDVAPVDTVEAFALGPVVDQTPAATQSEGHTSVTASTMSVEDDRDESTLLFSWEIKEFRRLLSLWADGHDIDHVRLDELRLLNKWRRCEDLNHEEATYVESLRKRRRQVQNHHRKEFQVILEQVSMGEQVEDERVHYLQLYARRLVGDTLTLDESFELEKLEKEEEEKVMAKLGKQHQVERPESRSDEGIQSPSQAKGFSPAFSFVAVVDQTPGAVQILTGSDNDAMPRLSDCESSTVVLDSAGLESVESDDTGLVQKERDQKDQMPEKEEVSFSMDEQFGRDHAQELVNAVEEDPNEISNTGSDSTKEETNNDSDNAHDLFLTNFLHTQGMSSPARSLQSRKTASERIYKEEFEDLILSGEGGQQVDEYRFYCLQLYGRQKVGKQLTQDELRRLEMFLRQERALRSEGSTTDGTTIPATIFSPDLEGESLEETASADREHTRMAGKDEDESNMNEHEGRSKLQDPGSVPDTGNQSGSSSSSSSTSTSTSSSSSISSSSEEINMPSEVSFTSSGHHSAPSHDSKSLPSSVSDSSSSSPSSSSSENESSTSESSSSENELSTSESEIGKEPPTKARVMSSSSDLLEVSFRRSRDLPVPLHDSKSLPSSSSSSSSSGQESSTESEIVEEAPTKARIESSSSDLSDASSTSMYIKASNDSTTPLPSTEASSAVGAATNTVSRGNTSKEADAPEPLSDSNSESSDEYGFSKDIVYTLGSPRHAKGNLIPFCQAAGEETLEAGGGREVEGRGSFESSRISSTIPIPISLPPLPRKRTTDQLEGVIKKPSYESILGPLSASPLTSPEPESKPRYKYEREGKPSDESSTSSSASSSSTPALPPNEVLTNPGKLRVARTGSSTSSESSNSKLENRYKAYQNYLKLPPEKRWMSELKLKQNTLEKAQYVEASTYSLANEERSRSLREENMKDRNDVPRQLETDWSALARKTEAHNSTPSIAYYVDHSENNPTNHHSTNEVETDWQALAGNLRTKDSTNSTGNQSEIVESNERVEMPKSSRFRKPYEVFASSSKHTADKSVTKPAFLTKQSSLIRYTPDEDDVARKSYEGDQEESPNESQEYANRAVEVDESPRFQKPYEVFASSSNRTAGKPATKPAFLRKQSSQIRYTPDEDDVARKIYQEDQAELPKGSQDHPAQAVEVDESPRFQKPYEVLASSSNHTADKSVTKPAFLTKQSSLIRYTPDEDDVARKLYEEESPNESQEYATRAVEVDESPRFQKPYEVLASSSNRTADKPATKPAFLRKQSSRILYTPDEDDVARKMYQEDQAELPKGSQDHPAQAVDEFEKSALFRKPYEILASSRNPGAERSKAQDMHLGVNPIDGRLEIETRVGDRKKESEDMSRRKEELEDRKKAAEALASAALSKLGTLAHKELEPWSKPRPNESRALVTPTTRVPKNRVEDKMPQEFVNFDLYTGSPIVDSSSSDGETANSVSVSPWSIFSIFKLGRRGTEEMYREVRADSASSSAYRSKEDGGRIMAAALAASAMKRQGNLGHQKIATPSLTTQVEANAAKKEGVQLRHVDTVQHTVVQSRELQRMVKLRPVQQAATADNGGVDQERQTAAALATSAIKKWNNHVNQPAKDSTHSELRHALEGGIQLRRATPSHDTVTRNKEPTRMVQLLPVKMPADQAERANDTERLPGCSSTEEHDEENLLAMAPTTAGYSGPLDTEMERTKAAEFAVAGLQVKLKPSAPMHKDALLSAEADEENQHYMTNIDRDKKVRQKSVHFLLPSTHNNAEQIQQKKMSAELAEAAVHTKLQAAGSKAEEANHTALKVSSSDTRNAESLGRTLGSTDDRESESSSTGSTSEVSSIVDWSPSCLTTVWQLFVRIFVYLLLLSAIGLPIFFLWFHEPNEPKSDLPMLDIFTQMNTTASSSSTMVNDPVPRDNIFKHEPIEG